MGPITSLGVLALSRPTVDTLIIFAALPLAFLAIHLLWWWRRRRRARHATHVQGTR